MNRMRVKCLICLVPYHANMETTVSIKCWHVHCTQCWLHVLGVHHYCLRMSRLVESTRIHTIMQNYRGEAAMSTM